MSVPQPFYDLSNLGPLSTLGTDDFWVNTRLGQSPVRQWDQLQLGPFSLPGLWQLEIDVSTDFEPVKIPLVAATKVTPPIFKNTLNDKGYNPAKLTATGRIWQVDDWIKLSIMLPLLLPSAKAAGSIRKIYDIYHPAASLASIDGVSIVGCNIPAIVDQTLFIRLSMVEWFQATPVQPLIPGTAIQQVDFFVPVPVPA